jgi:hypothetical protein
MSYISMCTKRADGLDFCRNYETTKPVTLAKRMVKSFLAMPDIGAHITSYSWLYWNMITHDNNTNGHIEFEVVMVHECGFVLSAHTLQQMQDSSALQLKVANRLIAFESDNSVCNINSSIPFAVSCTFNATLRLRNVETMAALYEDSD